MIPDFALAIQSLRTMVSVVIVLAGTLSLSAQARQKTALPFGVEEVCSLAFDKDPLRPARVENSALPCLQEAAKRLKTNRDRKLALVGVKDPEKDHEPFESGSDREEEDESGFSVRLEDLSAYRAVNTKWYLVHYLNADPRRILPTTDESSFAQAVTIYQVPASADFDHNILGTTKTNEKPCTITPCYSPDEETLKAQRRPRILKGAVDGSPAELEAEKKELAALQHHKSPSNMNGSGGTVPLAPLLPRPTSEHPATESIIPK